MSKVYIAMVLQEEMQPVWPEARQLQLEQTTNFKHRQARYTAWRLLRYALWEELGLRMEELHFSLEDGKWSCRECYFSITHSGCMVAVAVGHQPVGVDMEKFRRVDPELAGKILSDGQLEEFATVPPENRSRYLLDAWCQKECQFKCSDQKVFRPKEWDTNPKLYSLIIFRGDDIYLLWSTAKIELENYKETNLWNYEF